MFVGFKTPMVSYEVRRLPLRERDRGTCPVLRIESTIGDLFHIDGLLVPKTKDEMVVVLDAEDASRTLKATSFTDVPGLYSLAQVVAKLEKATIAFGKNPAEVVFAAFGAHRVEDVQANLRSSRWWLEFGLSGEARKQQLASLQRVAELLRYIPDVADLWGGDVLYDQGQPESYFGESVERLLNYHLGSIETELKSALNHEQIKLSIEVLPRETSLNTRAAEGISLWQTHFGAMWGPFGE